LIERWPVTSTGAAAENAPAPKRSSLAIQLGLNELEIDPMATWPQPLGCSSVIRVRMLCTSAK
jgi:hypothetical protein